MHDNDNLFINYIANKVIIFFYSYLDYSKIIDIQQLYLVGYKKVNFRTSFFKHSLDFRLSLSLN